MVINMGQLSIYLPPFASDYTGVCSTLFDFDCLTAINDPLCCTSHYVHYDEPRWSHKVRPVFSTSLRNIDAILGNDDKVVRVVCDAVCSLNTQMVALVGTPVPAITGMDMEGISCEIEERSARDTFGFNTGGYNYYDKGIIAAGKALITRYADPACEVLENSINILGLTPLDYGDAGNDTALREWLENAGWRVNASLFMDTSLEEVRRVERAQLNLAVSSAGVALAKFLKARFGTPWLAGYPMGARYARLLSDLMSANRTDTGPQSAENTQDGSHSAEYTEAGPHSEEYYGKMLIVSDQVMGNSLREALRLAGSRRRLDVASFFSPAPELAGPNDVFLHSERHLIELLRGENYQSIAADPYFAYIPEVAGMKHYKIVHPAVSSRPEWKNVPQYLSPQFEEFVNGIVREDV